MQVNTIGVVGHGHFGAFLVELSKRFLPEVAVRVYSRRTKPDGELFFDVATVARCDVVVLAGAIGEYEEQLAALKPLLSPQTVVVDVATVKGHTQALLTEHLSGQPWVACHPMFGPESYKKSDEDVSGFRIVMTGHTLPTTDFAQLQRLLTTLGFVLLEMTPDEHDKRLAETLFLTHYIGQTMREGGFTRTDIDTVSFSYLMNAVESVVNDERLFQDVYRFNTYCKEVAENFHDAQARVMARLQELSSTDV